MATSVNIRAGEIDMTQHELLNFIDSLSAWMGRAPTTEELSYNFFLNREHFVGGKGTLSGTLRHLRKTKAVKHCRCSEQCHSRHVAVTPKGKALLQYWDEHGCETENRGWVGREFPPCVSPIFKFEIQELSA